MTGSAFQNMAPNAKRSFAVTIAFTSIAVVLYLFAVEPFSDELRKERSRLESLQDSQEKINRDLRNSDNVRKRVSETEALMKPFQDALLTPLLESYAMRAKSLLDPLALGAGLAELEYSEEPFRALPLTKPQIKAGVPVQKQLFTRAAIRLNAKGSYQEAVSFLMRLEKEYPFVSLQSLNITAQQSATKQSISMILEWPAKGKVTHP